MDKEIQSQSSGIYDEQTEDTTQDTIGETETKVTGEQSEEQTQSNENKSKGVKKILSERNQARTELEQKQKENQELKQQLEELKQDGVATTDEKYIEKLAEQKAAEKAEEIEKKQEEQRFIDKYGDDNIDQIRSYVQNNGLSYEEASMLVRGQGPANPSQEKVVGKGPNMEQPKQSFDDLPRQKQEQFVIEQLAKEEGIESPYLNKSKI